MDTGVWIWTDPAVCCREQECYFPTLLRPCWLPRQQNENICSRTTGKCLLGTLQNKAQPGSSWEVIWPQIFPLLLTGVVAEGRAWSINWPSAFHWLCYPLLLCTGHKKMLLETPATTEGVSTLLGSLEQDYQQQTLLLLFAIPSCTDSISAWCIQEIWMSPEERFFGTCSICLVNSTNLQLICSKLSQSHVWRGSGPADPKGMTSLTLPQQAFNEHILKIGFSCNIPSSMHTEQSPSASLRVLQLLRRYFWGCDKA